MVFPSFLPSLCLEIPEKSPAAELSHVLPAFSVSQPRCHSLPCYMIYEIYKLVEKAANPPLHCIYLYFCGRAWLWNWRREINDILLRSTTKAHTARCPFPDCACGADVNVALGWEQTQTEPGASQFVKLYPSFFLWGFLLLWALEICQESNSLWEFRVQGERKAWSMNKPPWK